MSGCQRKFSMENCKKESAHKVAKRNATKTPLKPRLRISIFQLSPGNRLLRIGQSGVASSTKVPPNLKQRESVKLKGSVKKGKQEPREHHQTQHSPNSLALFATDSLELKLAYTAINEHTNTHKRLIFQDLRWSFSEMRDEQSWISSKCIQPRTQPQPINLLSLIRSPDRIIHNNIVSISRYIYLICNKLNITFQNHMKIKILLLLS